MEKIDVKYLVYLDESGAMHNNDKYFVIGGYITTLRTKEWKIQKEYEKNLKSKNPHLSNIEIKGSNLKWKNKIEFIKIVNGNNIETIVFIVDKTNTNFSQQINENDKYNYFIGLIYKYLINKNKIKIIFYLDSRPISNNLKYDLKEYLKKISIELSIDNNSIIDPPMVEYLDSKTLKNFNIRMSDIIANYIWNVYNKKIKNLLKINHKLVFPIIKKEA